MMTVSAAVGATPVLVRVPVATTGAARRVTLLVLSLTTTLDTCGWASWPTRVVAFSVSPSLLTAVTSVAGSSTLTTRQMGPLP